MAFDLGNFLRTGKKKLEGIYAQANMWDGGKTYNTVVNNRPVARPQQPSQTRPTQQRQPTQMPTLSQQVNDSYGTGFTSVGNRLRDLLDANTKADQLKRYANTGINETYQQEQARKTQIAQDQEVRRNAANQASAGGLSGLIDFFGKTPGSTAQMYGRLQNVKNPIAKTAIGIVNPTLGIQYLTGQAKRQGDTSLQYGRAANAFVENKKQQAGLGQKKNDNSWIYGGGQVATQLPAQLATGPLGLAGQSVQMASDEANKAEKKGKSNDMALLTGAVQGAASYASEKFGLDKFAPEGASPNMIINALKRFGTEGAQEAQQQFTQNLIANRLYDSAQGLKDGVLQSGILGGLAGGMSSVATDSFDAPAGSLRAKIREAKQNTTPLNQGGYVEVGRTPKNIHPEDQNVMSDFIDYQRGAYKPSPKEAQRLEIDAARIAERYGLDMPNTTEGLADVFDQRLQQDKFAMEAPVTQQPDPQSMAQRIRAAKERVLTPLNEGGYIQLGAPDPKDLSPDVKESFTKQGGFSSDVKNRLESNKLSKGDLERAGIIFDAKQVKKIAQTLPEFKDNPVMTYRKGNYSYTDAGYGRYPVPQKAYSGTLEFKHKNGVMRMNPEAILGEEMARKMAKLAKDGEQVDFKDLMKTTGNKVTTFEQSLDEEVGAIGRDVRPDGQPKGFILKETKGRAGRKDTVRVKRENGKLVATQQSEDVVGDKIADTLDIPKEQRVPTADEKVAQRVESSMMRGLKGDMTNKEIKAELSAREPTKPKMAANLKDKKVKQTFEQSTKEYLGLKNSAKIDRDATIADLNKRYKLSDKEKINAIAAIDNPSVMPMSPNVRKFKEEFKQLTDSAYKAYTSNGVKMGYVDSYLPRIYKNPETGQLLDRAEYELLQQGSKRMKGREAENVELDWLVEKDPTKLLSRYYESMDKAVAGQKYLKNLEDNGLVIASSEPMRGLRPIVAEGMQSQDGMIYYAQKDVANKLNTMFGSKEATNTVEKIFEKGQGLNSFFQSFVLSGGVPNTPINAFGIMQVMKEGMALHPIKAGKAFAAGMNKGLADKMFTNKKEILKLMAANDLDVRVDLSKTGKSGTQRIKDAFKDQGVKSGINKAWDEFTNDATFGRFMPMLETLHFEQVYKSARNRGASIADASALAAKSTKNFYGKSGEYKLETRSKAAQDASGALLFAPRFRESMLNFWGKNVQALNPKNLGKVEYRDNQKFMVASALTFAAMTVLNEALNGVQMWDNPDGKKDKLIIPEAALRKLGINTEGKDIAIPFLPSLATVPRNAASLAANLATGKFNEAGKNLKAFASMPIKTAGEIITNEDYFGNKIVQDDSSPLQKFTQAGSYIASSNMQPWIREGLNAAAQNWSPEAKKTWGIKDKSKFEAVSNAAEAPLRFYNPKYYRYDNGWTPKGEQGRTYTMAEQRERAGVKKQIDAIPDQLKLSNTQKAAFKALNTYNFDSDGNLKLDNDPFYQAKRATALQDDGVFEAMKKRAELENKLNGKPIDPIYTVSPSERRKLLWKKTLPQGTTDPTISKMYGEEWYQNYRAEEDKYFKDKRDYNKRMGYKDNSSENSNPYPEANKQLQAKLDYYYTLPKGTGARSAFLRSNPDVLKQWDRVEAWKNGERAQVGLGEIDSGNSYAYGSSRGGSGGGRGKKASTSIMDAYNLQSTTNKRLRQLLAGTTAKSSAPKKVATSKPTLKKITVNTKA